MNSLTATLTVLLVLVYSCGGQFVLLSADDFLPRLVDYVECPKSCPDDIEPICTANGFCIKLFDSPCQVTYFNCENKDDYKQIHERYCESPKFKNLQPKACFAGTTTSNKN